jgi:serine/threonine-protein kinase Stk1
MPDDQTQTFLTVPDSEGVTQLDLLPPSSRLLCPSCWCTTDLEDASWCPSCGRPPPADGWPSMPCTFRNRYTFLEQIERNARSAVFRAISLGAASEAQVLVKVVRDDGAAEAAAATKKAFRREAAVAGLLSDESASFAGVRGSDSEDPAYLALELAPWPTLDAVLTRAGALSSRDVACIGVEILRGVAYLEKQRLVHGSLIPESISITRREDQEFEVKIAGAGADPPKPEELLSGAKRGFQHISPEQWAGEPPSTSSDIYMVASMLWELATGKAPHPLLEPPASTGERLAEMREEVQRPDSLPEELHALLESALRFNPADRSVPGEGLLSAGVERELQRFLAESSRRRDRERQKLDGVSLALADVRDQLAPYAELLGRADEIEAELTCLREDPASAPVTREEVESLQARLREILSAVEAQKPAAEVVSEWPSTPPSSRPRLDTGPSWKSSIVPALVALIAGLAIGFGLGHAGSDSSAAAAPAGSISPARVSPSGDSAARLPVASAAVSARPPASAAASAAATSSARAAPVAAPSATSLPVAVPTVHARSPRPSEQPREEPAGDPDSEPKAAPEQADPY